MIRLEEVTKRYGETLAVDRLSLEVPEGQVCMLIGPSGSGKTTTLRMINRLIEPTSGRIFIGGRDTSTERPERLRRGLGYSIQSVGLLPHLTVAENISVVPELLHWDRPRIEARVAELLTLVGLEPYAYSGKYPRDLSGGEAQRVGVARALAADPPVLLMDEPFGAVDPLTRQRLQGEFARIQRQLRKTVIFVTHDIDEAIRLADRIALLKEGRLQQYDTPENLLDHPASKFAHDFVGADRALKRLVRVKVSSVMRGAVPRVMSSELATRGAADVCSRERFAYVVDAQGTLEGWLDCRVLERGTPPERASTQVDWRDAAVRPDASVKEALSVMLQLGFRAVAVTDIAGRLLGEVGMDEVEAKLAEGNPLPSSMAGTGSREETPR